MLKERNIKTKIGVVIGRFQVHQLTEGHKQLIDTVKSRHKKVLVLLGSTPTILLTRNQPMDFHTRMLMIQEQYPNIIILPIKDSPSDVYWSNNVDETIEKIFDNVSDNKDVTIYGSRDSFIPSYSGKYYTVELEDTVNISGKEVRELASDEVRNSEEFRRGIIYSAYNKHDVTYSTTDIACLKRSKPDEFGLYDTEIALVRKKNDFVGKWRLPGGFVSSGDNSFEDCALRELEEETGDMEVTDLKFIASFKVDDWRYKKENDSIMTSLFVCKYVYGKLEATDDVSSAKWFSLKDLNKKNGVVDNIIPEHVKLVERILVWGC